MSLQDKQPKWQKLAKTIRAAEDQQEENKPKFDNPDREGADNLTKADYIEQPEFHEFVQKHLGTGDLACYCCATCEYAKLDKNALFGLYCTKLQAEDKISGCCNSFEFEEGKAKELASLGTKNT